MARWRSLAIALVGAVLFAVMALSSAAQKSGTYDEFVHVTAGYSYWAFDDYRLNPENGNLSQRLVALPLIIQGEGGDAFPSRDQAAWHAGDMWELSDQFFFAPRRDAGAMLLAARVMVAFVGALLAIFVFYWSRALFGLAGACVTLALYAFSPTLLAHGALATSDMIATAFFVLALWALWRVLHSITPMTMALSTLAVSGFFLAKPSGPVFIPIALAMIAVQLVSARPVQLRIRRSLEITSRTGRAKVFAAVVAVHLVVGFVLIWAFYGFRYSAFAPGSAVSDSFLDSWPSVLDTPGTTTALATWGRENHALPEAYLYGLATVVAYSKNRAAFLNGQYIEGGTPSFFPYAILYKTTLAGLVVLALTPIALAWRRRQARRDDTPESSPNGLYELTPLLSAIAIYGALAMTSSLNIGHRHLLPLIPPTLIVAGVLGQLAFLGVGARPWDVLRLGAGRALAAVAVIALLGAHAAESLRVAPDYLAYFNAIAGGPSRGYRHLVDSSLDWGQDLPGLKKWLDREGLQSGSHAPVYLSYFGTALPAYYGIQAVPLAGFPDRWTPHEPAPLTAGIYCFSATMLQGMYLQTPGAWTPQYEKDYASMVYNLRLFDSTAVNPATRAALLKQTGEEFWVKNFHVFEHLRTARLAAQLRRREPDAQIGHSILVYRVNEEELSRALSGSPPE